MSFTFSAIIIIFVAGYVCIAMEHPLRINKAATALLLGVGLWTLLVFGGEGSILNPAWNHHMESETGDSFLDWLVHDQLVLHLGEIAEILFFVMGAMTIVELIDSFGGFKVITEKIVTVNRVKLLWVIAGITFAMAPVLGNLTTTIVMVTLLRKIMANYRVRWFYASIIIIAVNAGGVWSPIGDVTTIMLWVGGKVSGGPLILRTLPASIVCVLVPLIILSFLIKGDITHCSQCGNSSKNDISQVSRKDGLFVFCAGLCALLFVPVFKIVTRLPPYMGMMASLGVMWIITELMARKQYLRKENGKLSVMTALARIDMSCVLFFLGILLAVAALQSGGHLMLLGNTMEGIPLAEPEKYLAIGYALGIMSAIVDNVPLVAGAMGMYDFEMNHYFWMFVSYCAGTGGSLLIFASPAGVATMGLEKITFLWYFKKITLLAFIGFTAGALFFVLQNYQYAKTYTEQQKIKAENIILLNENLDVADNYMPSLHDFSGYNTQTTSLP